MPPGSGWFVGKGECDGERGQLENLKGELTFLRR